MLVTAHIIFSKKNIFFYSINILLATKIISGEMYRVRQDQRRQSRNDNQLIPFNHSTNLQNSINANSLGSHDGNLLCETIMRDTTLRNHEFRAKATSTSYDPRQLEFKNWCNEVYPSDPPETRYTVTKAKLVSFLPLKVIGRKCKNSDNEIGESSVKAYRNAVVDLYKMQRSIFHERPLINFCSN